MSAPPEVTENPIILDLKDSYGMMLIGVFLSCILYGVSCLQTFIYFSRYYDTDTWRKRKGFVAFVGIVDTANQCLMLQSVWPALIQHYGSIVEVGRIQPAVTHHAWISQIVAFCVQLFFIHRLWIFSEKNWFFAVPMFIMSLFQLIVVIPYNIIITSEGPNNSQIAAKWATSVVISLRAVTAGEDVIIAAGMIYLVLRNGMPEYKATRRMASRLIFLTVNTGFWTAAVAVAELSLVAAFPSSILFLVMEIPLCNLYYNALLANLNSRGYVRGDNFSEWNSTPSRGISNDTGHGTTYRLGGRKSDTQIGTPMVKIETLKTTSSTTTGKYGPTDLPAFSEGSHAVSWSPEGGGV